MNIESDEKKRRAKISLITPKELRRFQQVAEYIKIDNIAELN